MKIQLYRSLWGADANPEVDASWESLFPLLKTLGFDGIECSLGDIGERGELFASLLKVNGDTESV